MSDSKQRIFLVKRAMQLHGIRQWQMGQYLGVEDKKEAQGYIGAAMIGKSYKVLDKIIVWLVDNKGYELADFDPKYLINKERLDERIDKIEIELSEIKELMTKLLHAFEERNI